MPAILVDLGQSGCRVRTPDGRHLELALHYGSGASLTDTVAHILQASDVGTASEAGLSLTGLRGVAPDPRELGELCRAMVGAQRVAVADDGLAGLFGALAGADGIALAVGSGVSVVAKCGDRTAHRDGAGPVLGDDGGGFAIGREGLRAALRAAEGRGPDTAILAVAEARYGALREANRSHSDAEITRWCIDMAHPVLMCAEAGDPVASAIRGEAAQRLADSARAAWLAAGGTEEQALTVSGTGGVLRNAAMRSGILHALHANLPAATWQDPEGDNLDGIRRIVDTHPADLWPLLRWWTRNE